MMFDYLVKRVLQALLVLFVVTTVVFILLRGIGDPVKLLVSPEGTFEDYENLQRMLGLDKPLIGQYMDYLSGIVKGDFGNSFFYNRPVLDLIKEHIPATLQLSFAAIVIAIPFGIFSGIISAVKRNTPIDSIVTTLSIAGRSVPSFWLGIILILIFSVWLKMLPASGYGKFKQIILPAITLSMGLLASTTRLTRSSMLDVLQQDYMTTARAKGVKEKGVIVFHGLRNALLTVVTMVALQIGNLLGGSVVVESIFAWPGIGRLMVTAITNYDYPLVQACALVMAVIFTFLNFIVDILYTFIDPRIRQS
ncbi:ABC transporter permease [Tissierellaceae bacterium BX21]|jgi:peptide/nickel transport system permease protein|uniref:ABC transporter permease n=2 Tax=Paratissierella segnis TaxID=2763679 RepID=A0A926IEJ5_9FIRM|nr:ABC transporter permease [Paratissierella segnis]